MHNGTQYKMGRVRTSRRRTSKNKEYKKHHDTKRRSRDIDQIQDDLKKEAETNKSIDFEPDEDLPGLGQYYCTPCARHFANEVTLAKHAESKLHKRRLKDVTRPGYSQLDAELAAGKTKEILPPAHGNLNKVMESDI
mmetsp:Transcript_24238/g.34749  ORF Transcript_24238/g.34749 Transcript_24238/m.34749 type:complete len:137 (-) Transcript_24238:1229-1639(-)